MTALFWFPGLWFSLAAILLATVLAFFTEDFYTINRPAPRRAVKGRPA